MKRVLLGLMFTMAVLEPLGCASLNAKQEAEFQAMKAEGLEVKEKNPVAAAALGVLPGGGSFYTRQWGLGVVDLLLWPYSILWDPVAGYQGAEVINYETSRVRVKQLRARDMALLDQLLSEHQITQDEYIRRRRAIEASLNCYD